METVITVPHSDGSIMLGDDGFLTGAWKMFRVDEKMDEAKYRTILKADLLALKDLRIRQRLISSNTITMVGV